MPKETSSLERRLTLRIGVTAVLSAAILGTVVWQLRHVAWSVGVVPAIVLATAGLLYPILLRVIRRLERVTSHLLDANLEILDLLGGAVAKPDGGAEAHDHRVTIYAVCLAEVVGLDDQEIRALVEDRLSAGVAVSGGRYPRSTGGAEIPVAARIFAVVDVFDALTSRRAYQEPLSFDDAMTLLEHGRGRHFDPKLLDAFSEIARDLHAEFSGTEGDQPRKELDRITHRYFRAALDDLTAEKPRMDRPVEVDSPAVTRL